MNQDAVKTENNVHSEMTRLPSRPPVSIQETGLSSAFLCELVAKHLYGRNLLSLPKLVSAVGLEWNVIEEILDLLRNESLIEVKGPAVDESSLRYSLTDKGNAYAKDALSRDGYVGVAPVTIEQYQALVYQQNVHAGIVEKQKLSDVFKSVVVDPHLLEQLGAAINSSRAIFIYGPPGTGKSYLCGKLSECLPGDVLIPHAIYQNGLVIQVFDPSVHQVVAREPSSSKSVLKRKIDHRYILCKRPVIISGGELTADQLEIQVNQHAKTYTAPLQLKANNGIYLIDDLGRQKVSPKELFNRWIVPLENKRDFLSVESGQRLEIPFNVILIFSTNMNPLTLADDAFLRRIGHKVRFGYIEKNEFEEIWQQVCQLKNIDYQQQHLEFLFSELYEKYALPLLPCHPRDLIDMALDHESYHSGEAVITEAALRKAWSNYFISMDNEHYENTSYSLSKGEGHVK